MSKEKLRIGLLLDSNIVPNWFYKMIEKILESEHSEIVLIISPNRASNTSTSRLKLLWKSRRTLLYLLYLKLEDRLFKVSPNAFETRNLSDLIDCPTLMVTPKETRFSDRIDKADLEKIADFKIDVLIRGGFKILRGGILKIAKYGVWSYHHGDNAINRGGPAGAWEVLENWPKTGVLLQILTEDLDGGIKLFESNSRTDYLSIKRNKNRYYWKALSFIPRKLEELHVLGEKKFFEKIDDLNEMPLFYSNRLYKMPTNAQLLKNIPGKFLHVLKTRLANIFYFNQWILLFKFEKENKMSKSFFRFKRMIPPKDRFWADPFILHRDGTYYIFLEEYEYKLGRGNISVIEMDDKGNYGSSKIVLDKEYHLSYPFIYEEDDELYMIPESSQNKSVELYKCTEFPLKWELVEVMFKDTMATDVTIFKQNDTYWLFAALRENEGAPSDDELYLYHSESLVGGNWVPHPMNPVVSDVEYARPAGNIFRYKGGLFRPAQNGSKGYGYGIQIREIKILNKTEYRETQVQSIHPSWDRDLISTHTLNSEGKLTIIDALIRQKRFF